jgi:hypothetical protein
MILLALLGTMATQLGSCDRPGGDANAPGRRSGEPTQAVHVEALSTANQFCRAWKDRDYPAARRLLDVRLTRAYTDQQLMDVLAGSGNPRHAAFEVGQGAQIDPNTVAYRVRLYFEFQGRQSDRTEAVDGRIVLRRARPGSAWLVAEFPDLK